MWRKLLPYLFKGTIAGLAIIACVHVCSGKPSSLDVRRMVQKCEELAARRAPDPDAAQFPGVFNFPGWPVVDEAGNATWHSWVKMPSPFGVIMKRPFTCRYDAKADMLSVSFN